MFIHILSQRLQILYSPYPLHAWLKLMGNRTSMPSYGSHDRTCDLLNEQKHFIYKFYELVAVRETSNLVEVAQP